jgi:hypothetical protein
LDAFAVSIPVAVVGVVRIVPALVFAVVMPIAIVATFMLVLAFMLPVVMMVVSPLRRCADGECSGQRSEKYPG